MGKTRQDRLSSRCVPCFVSYDCKTMNRMSCGHFYDLVLLDFFVVQKVFYILRIALLLFPWYIIVSVATIFEENPMIDETRGYSATVSTPDCRSGNAGSNPVAPAFSL